MNAITSDLSPSLSRTWICRVCDYVYDEALGMPGEGIAPGTRFEDIPDDWACPDCGVSKLDFELVS
ncbi:MAG: rubredoxin [Burkholderiales bacterium]